MFGDSSISVTLHPMDPQNPPSTTASKPKSGNRSFSATASNKPTRDGNIWLVAVTASIGGGLFGYDTGIISAVLVYLSDSLGHVLSSSEKELVTALCSAGAFMGSIIAGMRADRYGRKGFATDL